MADECDRPGLAETTAGETAVAAINDGLSYRGYSIDDLAQHAAFVEVAYLLLFGNLPNHEHLADFRAILAEETAVPPAVLELLAEIPLHVPPMDALATGISALAHFDPQLGEETPEANIAKAMRLLAQVPVLLGARYRHCAGLPLVAVNPQLSYPANLLSVITGTEPSALHEQALEVLLILHAEHELCTSTFAARVVTSTGADLYSAMSAAIGAFKGPLHGGASERVMEILEWINSAETAEAWLQDVLANGHRIMGFGHRVYKTQDPRAAILKHYCTQLAQETGQTALEESADAVERAVWRHKRLSPNLTWPSARLCHYLGVDAELHAPLFVAGRISGWAAHVIEQSQNNRLIRPRAHYTGPVGLEFVQLSERG